MAGISLSIVQGGIVKPVIMFIAAAVFSATPAFGQDAYWGTIKHGSSTRIGDFEHYADGTSSTQIGNFKFYSDGTSEHTVGNTTFDSQGNSATKIGTYTHRSDGTSGTDIGIFHFYDGGSLNRIDGFTYRNR